MWLAYASAAAVCFGLRGILYQWTSQKPLNRNAMLFGVYLCGTIVSLIAIPAFGQPWTNGSLLGIAMGVFSYVSNASMYKGFAVGKASLVAIFTALPPVVEVVAAYFLWHETLSYGQIAAFVVILGGVLMIRYSGDLSVTSLNGMQWAVLAMLGFAITDLTSKQSSLWNGFTFPTLFYMYGSGASLFMASWLLDIWKRHGKRQTPSMPGDAERAAKEMAATLDSDEYALHESKKIAAWPISRTILWGMLVGLTNVSGMILLLPAFKLGVTGLVAAISAMNVILILLYARLFLQEKFSRKEAVGALLAILGVIALRLVG